MHRTGGVEEHASNNKAPVRVHAVISLLYMFSVFLVQ